MDGWDDGSQEYSVSRPERQTSKRRAAAAAAARPAQRPDLTVKRNLMTAKQLPLPTPASAPADDVAPAPSPASATASAPAEDAAAGRAPAVELPLQQLEC